MTDIRFTIATCTYNAAACLPPTLDSVMQQDYPCVEHLIIDGASKDSSLSLLEDYKRQSDAATNGHDIRIVSEPDDGLYHAMNKALRQATGHYILFLNAGDTLHSPDLLSRLAAMAKAEEQGADSSGRLPGVIYGQVDIVDEQRRYLRPRHYLAPDRLTSRSFAKGMLVCHQAFIAAADIAASCPYNTRYHYSADYDWCIRVMRKAEADGRPLLNSRLTIADYLDGGLTVKNHRRSLHERFDVMRRHYGLIRTMLRHATIVIAAVAKKATGK